MQNTPTQKKLNPAAAGFTPKSTGVASLKKGNVATNKGEGILTLATAPKESTAHWEKEPDVEEHSVIGKNSIVGVQIVAEGNNMNTVDNQIPQIEQQSNPSQPPNPQNHTSAEMIEPIENAKDSGETGDTGDSGGKRTELQQQQVDKNEKVLAAVSENQQKPITDAAGDGTVASRQEDIISIRAIIEE
ncbi:hypothetical protein A4A49_32279, partial [Nicotiana attenuata]